MSGFGHRVYKNYDPRAKVSTVSLCLKFGLPLGIGLCWVGSSVMLSLHHEFGQIVGLSGALKQSSQCLQISIAVKGCDYYFWNWYIRHTAIPLRFNNHVYRKFNEVFDCFLKFGYLYWSSGCPNTCWGSLRHSGPRPTYWGLFLEILVPNSRPWFCISTLLGRK